MPRVHAPINSLATHPRKFVRPLQLSRYTGVPIRTVYHHISKGALPAVTRGGTVQIRVEDAREYANEPAAPPKRQK